MSPKNTILTRRVSRKKSIAASEARRRPLTPSSPRLGAYGRKHPQAKITPGHKRVLRGRVPSVTAQGSNPTGHDFLLFCIKHILTSGNLVVKEGTYWRVRENVAGVNPGEPYTSLTACAQAMISSLESQFQKESHTAA